MTTIVCVEQPDAAAVTKAKKWPTWECKPSKVMQRVGADDDDGCRGRATGSSRRRQFCGHALHAELLKRVLVGDLARD
jgi:hypothetical protein